MPPRPVTPIRWKTLVAAGAAAGFGQAAALQADQTRNQDAPQAQVWLAQASSEAGEGGESGTTSEATPDAAFLTRIALVEGHLIGASALYARGLKEQGSALAGHPEAELMDDVRESLKARGATDFSDQLDAVGEAMYDNATQAEVDATMSALRDAIDAAETAGNIPVSAYFDTVLALTKAAAYEFAEATEPAVVEDMFAYHEAYGFVLAADRLAETLANSDDPAVAKAGARAHVALTTALAEFGDMATENPHKGDASVVYGAAARVELAALAVK